MRVGVWSVAFKGGMNVVRAMNDLPVPGACVPPDFLTLDEAAAVLRVGRSTAYREANAFEASKGATGIPVVRYGKQFRVPRFRLEEQLGGPITWPPSTSNVLEPAAIDQPAATDQPASEPTRAGAARRASSQLSLAIES